MEIKPARLQQAIDGLKISRMVGDADMLEHADRGNLVELAFDKRVITQLDRYSVPESKMRDLFPRIGELLFRESHPVGANAVIFGSVTDQRAPAAADVEQSLVRLEPQFAADHVELVGLRGCKIVAPVLEIGA